ncbi:MAG: hypothetical protein ACREO0_14195, partial [Pseudoxanthomonas sp.]
MKFEIGDDTDRALTTTLVHEMFLCTASFDRFTQLAYLNIMGRRDKGTKILCHDAYATFIHHLFEFYVGCIQRNLRETNSVPSEILDKLINNAVRKLLANKVKAIKNGHAPSWENDASTYQMEVPAEFSAQLRRIRNRTAHASMKRSNPGEDLSLGQFYKSYHFFVYLLFRSGQWSWTVKD